MPSDFLTVLFVELLDRSKSSTEGHAVISRLEGLFEDHLSQFNGVLRKTMEKGFMLTFENANEALQYAIEMQKTIQSLNDDSDIAVRMGLNSGEVTLDDDGDLYGKAVNIAARVKEESRPNEIYFSNYTYRVMDSARFNFSKLDRRHLKGVDESIVLSMIRYEKPAGEAPIRTFLLDPVSTITKYPGALITAVVVGAAIFLVSWFVYRFQDSSHRTTPEVTRMKLDTSPRDISRKSYEEANNHKDPFSFVSETEVKTTNQAGVPNKNNRLLITRLYNNKQQELFEVFNPSSETQFLIGVFEQNPGIALTKDSELFQPEAIPPCSFLLVYSGIDQDGRPNIIRENSILKNSSFGNAEGLRIVSTDGDSDFFTDAVGWSTASSEEDVEEIFYEKQLVHIEEGSTFYLRRKRNSDSQPIDTNNNSRDFESFTGFPTPHTGYSSQKCQVDKNGK